MRFERHVPGKMTVAPAPHRHRDTFSRRIFVIFAGCTLRVQSTQIWSINGFWIRNRNCGSWVDNLYLGAWTLRGMERRTLRGMERRVQKL